MIALTTAVASAVKGLYPTYHQYTSSVVIRFKDDCTRIQEVMGSSPTKLHVGSFTDTKKAL